MKKYIRVSILLLVLLFLFRFVISIFCKEKQVYYEIEENTQKYSIKEIYSRKNGNIDSHYYIEISFNNHVFPFRVDDLFQHKNYIIDTVYSFTNDEYICVLPIFHQKQSITYILCEKNEKLYFYNTLKNQSLEIDAFASSMKKFGHTSTSFKKKTSKKQDSISINNAIDSSHIVVIPSYKGIYTITSNTIKTIGLFESDVYSRPIETVVSKYYLVADYTNKYQFDKFLLVNIINGKKSEIKSKYSISMNSYIQGIVGSNVYILDKRSKKQYRVDVDKKTVEICGNVKMGMQYYINGTFKSESIYKGIKDELIFTPYQISETENTVVDAYNGIHYMYEKKGTKYEVSLSYQENPELYIYAFTIDTLSRKQYAHDLIYFIENQELKVFNPVNGVISILEYPEFFYNSKLQAWVYEK